jgi:hypothetical protein
VKIRVIRGCFCFLNYGRGAAKESEPALQFFPASGGLLWQKLQNRHNWTGMQESLRDS